MQFNFFYVVNKVLEAHRNGDKIAEAYWADKLDEISYLY
jgi:hypothetical protein